MKPVDGKILTVARSSDEKLSSPPRKMTIRVFARISRKTKAALEGLRICFLLKSECTPAAPASSVSWNMPMALKARVRSEKRGREARGDTGRNEEGSRQGRCYFRVARSFDPHFPRVESAAQKMQKKRRAQKSCSPWPIRS